MMTTDRLNTPFALFLVAFSLIAASVAVFTYISIALLERDIVPELERDSTIVGSTLQGKLDRALALGIPFNKLRGVREIMAPARKSHPGISYLVLTDRSGRVYRQVGIPPGISSRISAISREAIKSGRVAAKTKAGALGPREWILQNLAPLISKEAHDDSKPNAHEIDRYLNTAFLIRHNDEVVGVLHVGIDRAYIISQFEDITFGTIIVLLVSLLVVFEIFLFIIETGFVGPVQTVLRALARAADGDLRVRIAVQTRDRYGQLIDAFNELVIQTNQAYDRFVHAAAKAPGVAGRRMRDTANVLANRYRFASTDEEIHLSANRLADVRAPAFLFMFAEEIARPFIPLYIKGFVQFGAEGVNWLLVAIPMSVFIVFAAVAVPIAIVWSGRIGRRRAFSVGALIATVGMVGTAWAQSYWDLTAWRALSAIGYGIAYGACQGHVLDTTSDSNRAAGMGHFVVATVVASITGPLIGGVLADRFGFSATFMIGAAVSLISAAIVWQMLKVPRRNRDEDDGQKVGVRHLLRAFSSSRFVMLVLFGAIPAQIMMTGFVLFLLPLVLDDLGRSVAEIGHVMLLVWVVIFFTNKLVQVASDRFDAHGFFVGAGLILCGGGLIPVMMMDGLLIVVVAVLVFAFGFSMIVNAQLMLVTQIFSRDVARHGRPAMVSAFRIVERFGAAIGPLIAAILATVFGDRTAVSLLGIMGIALGVIFSFYFMLVGVVPEDDDRPMVIQPTEEETAP